MAGYALVRVNYEEPPGEAVTNVAHYGSLSSVEFPAGRPMTTYVVSDADGTASDRAAVENASHRCHPPLRFDWKPPTSAIAFDRDPRATANLGRGPSASDGSP